MQKIHLILTLFLNTGFLTIHAHQSTEENHNKEDSIEELIRLIEENKRTNKRIEINIGAEKQNNQPKQIIQNLMERMMTKNKLINFREKEKLRNARNILFQLRDHLYNIEKHCIQNIANIPHSSPTLANLEDLSGNFIFPPTKTSNAFVMPFLATQTNEGKHYNRWKTFFDKCNHTEFLPFKTKVNTAWDRNAFCEQAEIFISFTNKFRSRLHIHISNEWYKDAKYSKENLYSVLKIHTTFDDYFLTFINILYDIVVDLHKRWEATLGCSKL